MRLSGDDVDMAVRVLVQAFPSRDSLVRLTRVALNENAEEFPATGLSDFALKLVQRAEARDKVADLFREAEEANPDNLQLREAGQRLRAVTEASDALDADALEVRGSAVRLTLRPERIEAWMGVPTLALVDVLNTTDEPVWFSLHAEGFDERWVQGRTRVMVGAREGTIERITFIIPDQQDLLGNEQEVALRARTEDHDLLGRVPFVLVWDRPHFGFQTSQVAVGLGETTGSITVTNEARIETSVELTLISAPGSLSIAPSLLRLGAEDQSVAKISGSVQAARGLWSGRNLDSIQVKASADRFEQTIGVDVYVPSWAEKLGCLVIIIMAVGFFWVLFNL